MEDYTLQQDSEAPVIMCQYLIKVNDPSVFGPLYKESEARQSMLRTGKDKKDILLYPIMAPDGLTQTGFACICEDTPDPEDVYWEGINKPSCFGKLVFYYQGDKESYERALEQAEKHIRLNKIVTFLVEVGDLSKRSSFRLSIGTSRTSTSRGSLRNNQTIAVSQVKLKNGYKVRKYQVNFDTGEQIQQVIDIQICLGILKRRFKINMPHVLYFIELMASELQKVEKKKLLSKKSQKKISRTFATIMRQEKFLSVVNNIVQFDVKDSQTLF